MGAAARRAEREAERRRRALEKQQRQLEKLAEIERASLEVQIFENQIEVLQSVHQQCSEAVDWNSLAEPVLPEAPIHDPSNERKAQQQLDDYAPGFLDRLFRRVETKVAQLGEEIETAKKQDTAHYDEAVVQHRDAVAQAGRLGSIAKGVLERDPAAYIEAIREAAIFSDIEAIGESIRIDAGVAWCLEGDPFCKCRERYSLGDQIFAGEREAIHQEDTRG